MAAFITLEDGRTLYRSTVVMSGLLWRISQQVSVDRPKLGRWLADMSKRPVPFMDFDVRGFSESDRQEFYAATRRAGQDDYSVNLQGSTEALVTLLRMKESLDRGEPPLALSDHDEVMAFNGKVNDFDEIWDTE